MFELAAWLDGDTCQGDEDFIQVPSLSLVIQVAHASTHIKLLICDQWKKARHSSLKIEHQESIELVWLVSLII